MNLSRQHSNWIRPPSAILLAASTDQTRVVMQPYTEEQLEEIKNPTFCIFSTTVPKANFVGGYLVDALGKIASLNFNRSQLEYRSFNMTYVQIFTTDLTLLARTCINDTEIEKLSDIVNNSPQSIVCVQINCVLVSEISNSFSSEYRNISNQIQLAFKKYTDKVQLKLRINSAIHFDEELRGIISYYTPTMNGILSLPSVNNMRCDLFYDIIPPTITSVDGLHNGLENLQLFSIVPRHEINPLYLLGHGLIMKNSAETSTRFKNLQR
jgi:hypothetical protein